jgi:hypothetical protein
MEAKMSSDMRRIKAKFCQPGDNRILKVTGSVRTPLFLGMEDLCALEVREMVNISTRNGAGYLQGHIHISKGVFLENVIRMAEVHQEKTDDAKKMFVIASADDGHKAVFSWREVRNTSAGSGVMIVLEKDNESTDTTQNKLCLISTQDYLTDSRNVQGLRNIEVVLAR